MMWRNNVNVIIAGRRITLDVNENNGEAILLVHGLGGSANFWAPVIAAFDDSYYLIAPDLPCAARSDNDDKLSIESLTRDLITVLDELGINKAHVIGHSMGTIVCQHLAATVPDRVRSLALLGPMSEPPEAARAVIADRAALARREGMGPIADAIVAGGLSQKTRAEKPIAVGFVREVLLRQDPEGYALSCMALSAAQRAEFNHITCPSLLITGEDDLTSPPNAVRALAEQLPNARCEVLPACGHWTATEQPAAVVKLVGEFLNSID